MNDISQKLRNKRFTLMDEHPVQFVIETNTGARYDLKIRNISLTGLSASSLQPLPAEDGLSVGQMLAAAKISFSDHEYALGRMVIRSIKTETDGFLMGFSAVDGKVPVDGAITRYFSDWKQDTTPFDYELSPDWFSLASFASGNQSNIDLFAKVQRFNVFFKEWEKRPKFAYHTVRLPSKGVRVQLQKTRKNDRNDYIIMGSNDYLGLAAHPEVCAAAKKAIDDYGFGSTGSPVTSGMTALHEELAEYLARMLNKERVVLFNSGYAANVGAITGLMHEQDLIVADMISHASIQDGMQMSRATSRFFKHNNAEHLEKVLRENRDNYAGCLVVTEGIFSMDGDVAPLKDIIEVANRYKARLFVDEAHSFGVLGPSGLGVCDKFHALDRVDMIMGTFSKIGGGIGGFVATTDEVANWLYMWARAHMFSVSLPPSTAAAALKALQIFSRDKTNLLERLRGNIRHFVAGLRGMGYNLDKDHESAVIPVNIGDEKKLDLINKYMLDAGVFVVPIVYPAVSRNQCRFRFTVTAQHEISDLDYALNTLELAMEKADFHFPNATKKTA